MAAVNPYLIYFELTFPDGARPSASQIAGFNPNTGGWYPNYMQNIPTCSPPRDQPNLRFEVWSDQVPKGDTHR